MCVCVCVCVVCVCVPVCVCVCVACSGVRTTKMITSSQFIPQTYHTKKLYKITVGLASSENVAAETLDVRLLI